MNQWNAEFIVNIETAKKVCTYECGIEVNSIIALGEGWDNSAYLVNDKIVFRFPRREIAVSCMLGEINFLPIIKSSLPIPVLEFSEIESKITDKPYVAYNILNGKPVGEQNLSDDEKYKLVKPIAKFLKDLHATSLSSDLIAKGSINQEWRTDVNKRITLAEKMFLKANELGVTFNFKFEEMKELLSKVKFPDKKILVHGDFYSLHILIDEAKNVSGIIDWGDVHYGSPCIDLAIAFGYLPKESLPDFENEYGKLPHDYKLASAFRAFCNGLSLLSYSTDKKMTNLSKETLKSIYTSREWLIELSK